MKKQYRTINSLDLIKEQYVTYLIDIGGVICDGQNPLKNAVTVINDLIQQKKQIVFLSNNPRPSTYIEKQLKTFGIIDTYRIVTSGEICCITPLAQNSSKKKSITWGAIDNMRCLIILI